MNWRERIIKTIKSERVDFLPFAPRLDLWYKSNKLNGTLPQKYKNSSLENIALDLDVGFNYVVPDFRNFIDRKSGGILGLGIYDLKTNPYRIIMDSIDFESVTNREGLTTSFFETPYGKIITKTLYNEKMRLDGATIGHTIEHAVKNLKDVKPLGYIFEQIAVEENYKDFLNYKNFIGDNGVCIAFSMLSGSPMHHIMKELMPFEKFIYELNDNRKELEGLAEKIGIFFKKVLSISLKSQSDIIFLGANYDIFLTWPPFFKEFIMPYLKEYSVKAHKLGKFILTHADGENSGLIQEYLDGQIDIADSICPYPMTDLTLKEVREKFNGKITIWGGLPSISVLEESMSDVNFDRFINEFFTDLKDGRNIILSFADTTPPGAKFERIEKVAKMARNFSF